MSKVKKKEGLKWGVFNAKGSTHVAPCDKNGVLAEFHILSEDCFCEPVREPVSDMDDYLLPLYSHNRAH